MKLLKASFMVVMFLLLSIILIAAILIVIYLFPLAKKDFIQIELPEKHVIQSDNYFETQGYNECAAFAAAYVLRCYGNDQSGKEVYRTMTYKLPILGVVPSKGIIKTFQQKGLAATYYKGNINTIKMHIAKDRPVILYIGDGLKWEHYVTMIGYDNSKKEIYLFDSLQENDLNEDIDGNRTISEEDLLSIWDNGLPFLKYNYIVAEE